jgi:hypothetical protein
VKDADAAQTDASVSAWAAPLLGQYGIRARFFERDAVGTPGMIEWVMLGTFGFDAARGKITLKTQL